MRTRVGAVLAAMLLGSTVAGGTAGPARAASGWQPTESMSTVHAAHGAALLRDGRVLVVSGFGDVPVSELYDPETGTWSVAAPPLVPRHYATTVTLSDGRVLVAGGDTAAGVTTHAEIYDPNDNTWTATGAMNEPRAGHMLVRLNNGRVLVTGGSDSARNASGTAELYDPATGTWSPAGSFGEGRENHQATLLPDGRVLVAGGFHASPTVTFRDSSAIFDPSDGTWTSTGSFAVPRGQTAGGLLGDGTVLTTGGVNRTGFVASAERFDPATGRWSSAGASGIQGNIGVGTTLRDGTFLLTMDGSRTTPLYDPTLPAEDGWSSRYASTAARSLSSITRLQDGRVLLAGGVNLRSAEIFTPPTTRKSLGGQFGAVAVGASVQRDVTIENGGGNPLWIDAFALSGPDAADFAVVTDDCVGTTVAPGGTCTVQVRLKPSAVGPRTAELTFDDNAETSPSVPLTSEGPRDDEPTPTGPAEPAVPRTGTDGARLLPPSAPICSRRFVTLIGIEARRGSNGPRARLTGVASRESAGARVVVRRDGRAIATTSVRPDGTISAVVPGVRDPGARYRLVIDPRVRSNALKAGRLVQITGRRSLSAGRVRVRGRVRGVSRPTRLTVQSLPVCGPVTIADRTVRTDRRGRFSAVLAPPVDGVPAVVHRIRQGARTVTLPVVVAANR